MTSAVLPRLSVIVPVLDEAAGLPELFATLAAQSGVDFELILCDGGSRDGTPQQALTLAASAPFPCRIISCEAGRGKQMNAGAGQAAGEVFLFLHADSRFPDPQALARGMAALEAAVARRGDEAVAGRFALRFRRREATPSAVYHFYEAKARLNRPGCIHGDQGFLLPRSFFSQVGPFDEELPFLEDDRLAAAVFRAGEWILLPVQIETSARRFEAEGLRERQILNALILNFDHIGWSGFLRDVPGLYRRHGSRLDLLPFFERIREELSRLPPEERRSAWRCTGAYVRSNAWQLAFVLDRRRHFKRNLPPGQGENRWLERFEPFFDRLTDHPLGHAVIALFVRLWFAGMRRRLRRQKKKKPLAAKGA